MTTGEPREHRSATDNADDRVPWWRDRIDLDDPHIVRALAWSGALGFGVFFVTLIGAARSMSSFLLALACALIAGIGVAAMLLAIATFVLRWSARAAGMLYAPSDTGTPPQPDYSLQDAMAMRGDVAGALASLEELIASAPDDARARAKAADLYATRGNDPARAAHLFQEMRTRRTCTSRQDVYATNRLIDLYSGPLADDTAMMRELERLANRYAGSKVGDDAHAAWVRLKGTVPPSQHDDG